MVGAASGEAWVAAGSVNERCNPPYSGSNGSTRHLGSYARRIEIHGVILPAAGLQVSSPVARWIQSMDAHEGQLVTSRALLYVVNTDIANSKGGTQQQVLQSLGNMRSILMQQIVDKVRLRNEQDAELRLKGEDLQSQVQQLDPEILTKDEFLATITENYVDFTHYQQRVSAPYMRSLRRITAFRLSRDASDSRTVRHRPFHPRVRLTRLLAPRSGYQPHFASACRMSSLPRGCLHRQV